MFKFQPGQQFAEKYTLVEKVGIGGFAEVWKVKRTATGFVQAIKIFSILDEAGALLAADEFERVFNLNHPRLLKAGDYGVFQGHPYLVMPFCKKGTALKHAGKLEEKELLKAFQDIASALSFLHGLDDYILHQDIKSDNFLIDDQGNYLLADFGISKKLKRSLTKSVVNNRKTELISDSKNSGSTPPAYRPPETFDTDFEKRKPIKASDIWSLGATMFELATEELPFGDFGGLIQKQGTATPNLPKDRFSNEFNELIKWCLQPNTWDRPTAQELYQAITDFQNSGAYTIPIQQPKVGGTISSTPSKKKSRSLVLVLSLVALLALSGFGMFYFKDTLFKTHPTSSIIKEGATPKPQKKNQDQLQPSKSSFEKVKPDVAKDVTMDLKTNKPKSRIKDQKKTNKTQTSTKVSTPTIEKKQVTRKTSTSPFGQPISAPNKSIPPTVTSISKTKQPTEDAIDMDWLRACQQLVVEVRKALAAKEFIKAGHLISKRPPRDKFPSCQSDLDDLDVELTRLQTEQEEKHQLAQQAKAHQIEKEKKQEEENRQRRAKEKQRREEEIASLIKKGDSLILEKKCKRAISFYERARDLKPSSRGTLDRIDDKIVLASTSCQSTLTAAAKPISSPKPEIDTRHLKFIAHRMESIEKNMKSGEIEVKKSVLGQYSVVIDERSMKIDIGPNPKETYHIVSIDVSNKAIKQYTARIGKKTTVKIELNKSENYFYILGTQKKNKPRGRRYKI